MERLKELELQSLLAFVGECYEATSLEDFVSHVLRELSRLIPGDLVSYSEMDPENSVSRDRTNPPELSTPEICQRFDRHMHEHPVLLHNMNTGDTRAWRISDFRSQRQFRRCSLFNEFYRYIGIADGLCFALPSISSVVVGIAIHRNRWGFPERMRLLARSLQPQLARAWSNARNLDAVHQQITLCSEGCMNSSSGIVILTPTGQPLFVNTRAREYMRACFGESDARDGLPTCILEWVRHQSVPQSTFIGTAETSWTTQVSQFRLRCRLVASLRYRMLILEAVSGSVRPFGLTPSEEEVLGWVAAGKTNPDIGSILQKSPATVKKQLQHIYNKMGVETRTAAAALFLKNG